MQNNITVTENLVIDGRKKLSMTGVQAVDGFSEQFLKLTVSGNKVYITGENIRIVSFSKATGNLIAEGIFNEVKYNYKKLPFVKRLFK